MSNWWHLKLSGLWVAFIHIRLPFMYIERLTSQRMSLLIGGEPRMHVSLYIWHCNLGARPFPPRNLMAPWWIPRGKDYDKLSVKITNVEISSSHVCECYANGFSSILWLVLCLLYSRWYLDLSKITLHSLRLLGAGGLAKLSIVRAWIKACELQVTNSKKLQVALALTS